MGILEAFSILDPSGVLGEPETSMEYLSMLLDQYDVEGPMGIDRSDREKKYQLTHCTCILLFTHSERYYPTPITRGKSARAVRQS